MILDEGMTQNLRKELKELNEKGTEKKKTTSTTNEFEKHPQKEALNGVVGNSTTKELLVMDLQITSQNYEVISDHKWKRLDS